MKKPKYISTRPTIRLPSRTLDKSPLFTEGEEFDSLEQLANRLTNQCIGRLIDLVYDENPLGEIHYSSVVWLRSSGNIELVQENHFRDQSLGDLVEDSLFVEVFRSERDAVPFSRFYDWIPDENGPYVGDMAGRRFCIKPRWDSANNGPSPEAYQAVLRSINFRRLLIRPMCQRDAIAEIRKWPYREKLRSRILQWLVSGHFAQTLERLSFIGLKGAARRHGADFISRWGRARYFAVVAAKTQRALADGAIRNTREEVLIPDVEVSHLTSNATISTSLNP